uniref:Uncharacterized protein n=1 Tax=Setaria viridis TaxID=4556 RepID=A0A4U6TFI4_SETVI|nr:hypothetical protein SEVIR_8G149850v2 [Setaria viridis]
MGCIVRDHRGGGDPFSVEVPEELCNSGRGRGSGMLRRNTAGDGVGKETYYP